MCIAVGNNQSAERRLVAKETTGLSEKELKATDIVIITTDHSQYDYNFIVKNAAVVIDTRNATKKITDETLRKKIVLLGAGENK